MGSFVRMAGVGARMGLMEGIEARNSAVLEVTTFVSNIGPTGTSGIIKGIIVAPIAVV
jgi:hypothetical protein